MALPEETPRVLHAGNNTRGPFSLSVGGTPISYADGSQIVITRYDAAGVGTLQIEGTHYELSAETALPDMGDASRPIATASFTFKLAQPVLAEGQSVLAERVSTVEQALVLALGGGFSAPANERNLDAIIRIAQELTNKLDRVVTINALDANGALKLPAEADRAGKFFTFDENGDPTAISADAGLGDMLAANNLSDVADVPTSRTNLGLGSAALLSSGAVFQAANNLSEGNATTMRANLGLGSIAVLALTDVVSAAWSAVVTTTTLLAGLALQLLHIRIFVVDYYIAINSGNHTLGIRAACSAAIAAGGGRVWYTPGATYNPYPDATDTSSLGSFSSIDGVTLEFNGSKHYVARAFTDGQTIFPYVFEDTDNIGWGAGTFEQAQKDDASSSPLRGTCWITLLNRNEGVRGGPLRIMGGKDGVSISRDETDPDLRTSDVKLAVHGSNLNKPLGLRNSGTDVEVDLVAIDCARGLIAYGYSGLNRIRLRRYSTGAAGQAATILSCNSTGSSLDLNDPNASGMHLDYQADGSHGAYLATNHLDIEFRGTDAMAMRNTRIHVNVDADQSGSASQQLIIFRKRSDDSTVDTTTRGHVLDDFKLTGTYRGTPNTPWGYFFRTNEGDWAGETIRGFKVSLVVTGHASASYAIDYDGFADGPVFEDCVFPGTRTETGTRPASYTERNFTLAGVRRAAWFANTALKVRDTNDTHDLIIKPGANLTAERTLTVTTKDADQTLDLSIGPTSFYTEGTWTPALSFVTPGDLNVAYTTQVGTYIRIGNLVIATFNIVTSSFTHTTAASSVTISGLPAASKNVTSDRHYGAMTWSGITKAGYTNVVARLAEGSTTFLLDANGSGSSGATVTAADMPSGGTVTLRGTLCYHAA